MKIKNFDMIQNLYCIIIFLNLNVIQKEYNIKKVLKILKTIIFFYK